MDSARNTGASVTVAPGKSRQTAEPGFSAVGSVTGRRSTIAGSRGGTMPWHDEELWDDAPFEIELEA
jgi:hypothetical protein